MALPVAAMIGLLATMSFLTLFLTCAIFAWVVTIRWRIKIMAGELAALTQEVNDSVGVMQSAEAALAGLEQRLLAAIASGDPAALTSLATSLGDERQKLAAAIAANPIPPTP